MKTNQTNRLYSAVRRTLTSAHADHGTKMTGGRGASAGGLLAPACLLGVMLLPAVGHSADTISDALTGGKASVNVRARYENVQQDNVLKDANAFTVRTLLGYGTADYLGVSAFMEFSNTTAITKDDYNSGPTATNGNGRGQYSAVADPELSEVNQAYLAYGGFNTVAKLGHQRIKLDNDRWIGNVGWRQNEQTYDAVSIVNSSLPDTTITLDYLTKVQRITGAHQEMDSPLLNASYKGWGFGSLTGYAYLLDYDAPASASSTQTYGLRFAGSTNAGEDNKIMYTLEYASQSDYAHNPGSYNLNYMLGEIGDTFRGWSAKLGYEVLEGNGTYAVQTPLATLHAFNGWADQFAGGTPPNGLKDAYLDVGANLVGVNMHLVYHDFQSDHNSSSSPHGNYGNEVDFVAAMNFAKMYTVTAKYASYSADKFSVDTNKLWLMAEMKI